MIRGEEEREAENPGHVAFGEIGLAQVVHRHPGSAEQNWGIPESSNNEGGNGSGQDRQPVDVGHEKSPRRN
jgi:hypothetical protein